MPLTAFDKQALPQDLDTLKALIDERQAEVTRLRSERTAYNATADEAIQTNEEELKILRLKAADILGIPSKLEVPEGKVPTQKERGEGKKEVATPAEEGVK